MSSRPASYRPLSFILLLYLCLAVAYSVVVPIGRGADEWAHYWYTRFIAQNNRLPLSATERDVAGYKSDWPPLYHLAAAGLTAWIDTSGPPVFKYRPDALPEESNLRRQLVPGQGQDAILHTEDERFPWQQEILVWHLGRFLSIGFALAALLVTYQLALEVFNILLAESEGHSLRFPWPQRLALVAVAVLAFNPRFLFTGMLLSYDSLTLLLASLFLWVLIRIAKGYSIRGGFWILGGLAGLALLTKYLAALLPLQIIFLAYSRSENSPFRHSRAMFRLGQAGLAFFLVTSSWFGYLLLNFNEIERYGPVLGTLAPLLRGDGSDRTVEQLFAWVSGGQAPPPAHLEAQPYTSWQILAELPLTFWAVPITQPFPLTPFVWLMTFIVLVGIGGWLVRRRMLPAWPQSSRIVALLLLHCFLPLPFMAVRLFGARDALEAVQGRHILFLAGPAVVILLVWGLWRVTFPVSRFAFYLVIGLLLGGAMSQLIYMWQIYPPLLPVQTTPYQAQGKNTLPDIRLPGGARLIDVQISPISGAEGSAALRVSLFWQGGPEPAPEDYQTELALVDASGQPRTGWLAYQTQARYPTRTWEPGDTVRDEGYLPLVGLASGDYEVRLRILGEQGPVVDWQTLARYPAPAGPSVALGEEWILWHQGYPARRPPLLHERETGSFTFADLPAVPQLTGPDNQSYPPASAGESWANFIIGPDWPAGEYRWQPSGEIALSVAPNERNFQPPLMDQPVEANFAGQIKLLGYYLPTRRVQPGDGLTLTLYWQGLRWLGEDFVIFNRLLDNQGMAWGGYDRRAKENYSTLLWAPGQIISDSFAVPVDPAAPPGVYTLSLGWYRRVAGQADPLALLDPATGQPTEATAVTIGPIKVGGPPPGVTVTRPAPQTDLDITLGEQIKLLGFDLTGQTVSTANPLHLTLYWQAVAAPEKDYTVFVHVRHPSGEIAAQTDRPPVGGAYPTSLWEPGEIIKDEFTVSLEGVAAGPYEVVLGLYDFQTGLRLSPSGPHQAEIHLAKIQVARP